MEASGGKIVCRCSTVSHWLGFESKDLANAGYGECIALVVGSARVSF